MQVPQWAGMGWRGRPGPRAMSWGCGHGTDYFLGPTPVFAGGSKASAWSYLGHYYYDCTST